MVELTGYVEALNYTEAKRRVTYLTNVDITTSETKIDAVETLTNGAIRYNVSVIISGVKAETETEAIVLVKTALGVNDRWNLRVLKYHN